MSDLPADALESSEGSRQKLEEVADRFLEDLRRGEDPDRSALAAAHPDLAPRLEARLRLIEAIFAVGRAEITPPESAAPPSKIGRFEVLGLLGRGAFGSVYKARDSELDRHVAIKVPRAGSFATAEEEKRFLREARSAARLKHPSIVSVHEIGYDGDLPYIVSDCIEGPTLADRLLDEPPGFRLSAELCLQIAEALEHAHGEKVVHRDVKPQNIILDASGRAHVADFGLARREENEATVTSDGQILGTPAYMSPEQAAGEQEKVGPLSDVYSLGVVLYELLTGERPFRGPKSTLIHRVLHEEPRTPRSLNDRIPVDLETICLKAMAKEPARRYSGADSMKDDLKRFLAREPILARPIGRAERLWRWARRKPVIATLSASVAVLIVTVGVVSTGGILQVTKARDEATTALEKSEERLVRLSVANGARLLDDGDTTGALLWFVEALRLDRRDGPGERIHRLRIGTLLSHCSVLDRVWFQPGAVVHAAWSPDGKLALTICGHAVSVWDVESGRLVASLEGHAGPIEHATFSADSKSIVTAGADSTARVWEAGTGRSLLPPLSHSSGVRHAVFSPDGQRVATSSADKTVRLWDAATGASLAVLQHNAPVNRARFSPDGTHLLTVGASFGVRVWEVVSGKMIAYLRHRDYVQHAEFSPDGSRIVTACRDQRAQIWNVATGAPLGLPMLHELAALHATFSPDGRRVATASFAITSRIWDAFTGAPLTPRLESRTYLEKVQFRPDGQRVLSIGMDGAARLWNPGTGQQVGSALQHGRHVRSAVFSPDGRRVLTASEDGTARLWEPARGHPRLPPLEHRLGIGSASFSPDGSMLVTASDDRTAQLWETSTGNRIGQPLLHEQGVLGAEFSFEGRRVLTASKDGARIWETATGKQLHLLKLPGTVLSATFSRDSRLVAATGGEGAVQVWDSETGTPMGSPLKHELECRSAAFSPDGRWIATGSHDKTVQVWEALTGKPVGNRVQQEGAVFFVAFSPDGTQVAAAGGDGAACVFIAASGEPAAPPLRHVLRVERVAYSPDGRHVLTASHDATAQVWESASGRPASPRLEQGGMIRDGVFSPDGALVGTASEDGTARVWDWRTGEPVTPLLRHSKRANTIRFSPSGLQVLTSSKDGTAKLWDIRYEGRPVEDLLLLARVLSGRRISSTGSLVILEADEFRASWEEHESKRLGDPAAPAAAAYAWHQHEALAAQKSSEWAAFLWHLDRLPAEVAGRPEICVRRANVFAALGEWGEAADEYRRGEEAKHGEHDVYLANEHAIVRLKLGDTAGYREACERLAERHASSENSDVLNEMAWTCVLGPAALRDATIAVKAAKKALLASPNNLEIRDTVGAALYRAGEMKEAIKILNEGIRLEGRGGIVWDWVFLAMASRRTGRAAEADALLQKARNWVDEDSPSGAKAKGDTLLLDWRRRAELDLLLEEAQSQPPPGD